MNLIEQLGGYEKTKERLLDLKNSHSKQKYYMEKAIEFINKTENAICEAEISLLEYRRSNNIFDEDDLVVFIRDWDRTEPDIRKVFILKNKLELIGSDLCCLIRHTTRNRSRV